jgi:hypothetical protein
MRTAALFSGCLTAAVLSFAPTPARADASEAPSVRYVFVPHSGAQRIESLDVLITLPASPTAPGAPLIETIVDLLGAPTAAVDAKPIAHDEKGLLELSPVEVAGEPYIKKRGWAPGRAAVGAVTISYSVPVATNVVGPNFTLTSEGRSVLAAGMTFVVVPALFTGGVLNRINRGGLGVCWTGSPHFDVERLAQRTEQTFEYYQSFFKWSPTSYQVFLR